MGYDDVLENRFPRLIHCSVTGFGPDGPFGGLPGYDAAIQAWTGLISINGTEEGGGFRLGIPLVDLGTGLYAAIGILAAVQERHRSGRGQHIDTTLFDCGFALQHPHAPNFFQSNERPKRTGNAHPNIAPYDLYQTEGRELFLAVGNNGQFRKLCDLLGRPDLADDPRFKDNSDRSVNRDALRAELETVLNDKDGEAIATALLKAGVPAGAALTVPDVASHPHIRHREMVVEKDGYRGTGIPVKLSRTPGAVRARPPYFAEHAEEVLAEAGYSEAEIERLFADGIAFSERRK